MTPKQLRRHIEREGFWLKRDGSNHLLWTDGITTIPMSKGSKMSSVNVRNQLAEIRRAVLKREKSEANRVLSITLREMKDNVREPERRVAPVTAAEIQKFNAIKESPVANGHTASFEIAETPNGKPVTNTTGRKIRYKIDGVTKLKLRVKIAEMWDQGIQDYGRLTIELNRAGFKAATGDPLDQSSVRYFTNTLLEAGVIRQPSTLVATTVLPPATRQAKPGRLPDAVMSILTEPDLSAEQKVRMCLAYAEL